MASVRVVREIRNLQVHWADGERCLGAIGDWLVSSADQGVTWRKLVRLPVSPARRWLLQASLFARLVRGGVRGVWPVTRSTETGWVVSAQGQLFRVLPEGGGIKRLTRIERGRGPLRKGLSVLQDHVFWGEYWKNPQREPVHILSYDLQTSKLDFMHQFGPGEVRHVHAVQLDPYSDRLWIATGDENHESAIWTSDTSECNPVRVSGGSQKWRTVGFVFRSNAVYWGTDHPHGENHIWRLDRESKELRTVGEVVGPVYYSVSLKNCAVFGTTVERGEGHQDGYARLYALGSDDSLQELWKLKKDRWHSDLFGYGVFEFAEQQRDADYFWVTARGLAGGLKSYLCKVIT